MVLQPHHARRVSAIEETLVKKREKREKEIE
jgi:hypothetical protein